MTLPGESYTNTDELLDAIMAGEAILDDNLDDDDAPTCAECFAPVEADGSCAC